MAKIIIINNMARGIITDIYDNTPTNSQFVSMFNQCISKINTSANISLPEILDKSGTRPDYIEQEAWDNFIDTNGVYMPLDDYWVRRMIVPFIGYRLQIVEEGANSAESQEAYGDFITGLNEFKTKLPNVIDEKYNTTPGQVGDDTNSSGNIFVPDLDANPFTGGNF